MKKFLSLMLVVVMLAFASSAMAAVVSLTPSQSSVVVLAGGGAVNITLSASGIEESEGPTWSFDITSNNPPTWVTLDATDGKSSTTILRLTPASSVTAGNYTVTVRVRASRINAGHPVQPLGEASTNIRVMVAQNADPTRPIARRETIEIIVDKVSVINSALAKQVEAVLSSTASQMVAEDLQAFIDELNKLFYGMLDASEMRAADIPSDTKVLAEGGITATGAAAKTIASEAAKRKFLSNNDSERVIGFVEQFRANDTGIAVIELGTFNEVFWGKALNMNLQNVVDGTNTNIDNEAVFINSSGDVITTIPGAKSVSSDPTPGFVTAVCYVESGKTYDPVIYTTVTSAEAAAFDAAAGTTVQSVTIEVTETVYETSTFSPVVEESALIAIASARGIASKDLKLFSTTAAEGSSWDISTAESTYMTANDIDEVAKLPRLKDVEAGTYVAKISFDKTPREAQVYSKPTLYPYGVKANGAATDATVYAISNNEAYEVPGSAVYEGMTAYLVVTVGTNGVAVADTDVNAALVTIDRPTIAVKLNNVIGVGSSSGGCSAGSAVLALALLGTFIAARKK